MSFLYRLRFPFIGWGPILVSVLVTAAVIAMVGGAIHGTEIYPDPVASAISWDDVYKAKDIKAVELSVLLITGLSIGIAMVCQWIAAGRVEMERALNELLLVSLIPAAWRLALACSIPNDHFPPLRYLAAFPLTAMISIWAMVRYRATLLPQQVMGIGGGILVSVLVAVYAGLAFPLSISRLIPKTVAHLQGNAGIFAGVGVGLTVCAIIAIWIASNSADLFERRIHATLKWIQYPLPLLFFYLVPPQIIDPLHRFANPYPHALVITLVICCFISWFFMWRRFSIATDGYPFARALAPIAVAAILLFIYSGTADLPRAYRDHFHWGEQVLPWQQWWDFGKRPYVDYVPVHGLMPFMRGFFSEAFFDGSAASYTCSDVLMTGLAAVALGLGASALLTPLGALFLLLGDLPLLDRMYFLAPAMFLVASPSLLKKPVRHLSLWIIVCILMVAYNPTIGPAFVVGTLPLALWLAYRLCRENPVGLTIIILVVAGVVIGCWETPPVRAVEIQFTHFILDNAWTNEVAHGIAWDRGTNQREPLTGLGSTQFLWEVGRIAWALVALFAATIFWKEFRREPQARRTSLMILAATTPLIFLVTVPWIFGRIDPGAFGRSGSLSRLAVYAVLPALVMLYVSREKLIGALLLTALAIGYFYPSNPSPFDLDTSITRAVRSRVIPPGSQMMDGHSPDIGLPRLGQVVVDPVPNFISDIIKLKKILREFLKPGETYLDLTNQSALYYYLGLPSPVRYPSFVAANSRLTGGELQQLESQPIHSVMISPPSWIDGATASLRTYEVYRKYALEFRAVKRDPWVFLVDPARFPSLPPDRTEDEIQLLDDAFRKPNLLRLPISWGQSWKNMQNRFDHVASIDFKKTIDTHDVKLQADGSFVSIGPSPFWDYAIPPVVKDGAAADFVRLTFDGESNDPTATKFDQKSGVWPEPVNAEPAMACYWTTADGHLSAPIQFKAFKGNLVLPLGAYPHWLLVKSPATFRLAYENPKFANWFKVSQIEFLHLRPL